jgi:hypothetical protein
MAARKDFLVRMPRADYEALRSLAFFTRQSMNEIVCSALHTYLETDGRAAHVAAVIDQGRVEMRDLLDKLGDS